MKAIQQNIEQNFAILGRVSPEGVLVITESHLVSPMVPVTEKSGDADADYLIAFLDTKENILHEHFFSVRFKTDDQPQLIVNAIFNVVSYFPQKTSFVEIRQGQKQMLRITRNYTVPVVSNVSVTPLRSNSKTSQLLIQWFGADIQPDNLTSSISYSLDHGNSFRPIAGGLRDTKFVLPLYGLGGSDQALIKLTASNGFNSYEAISDYFSIPYSLPIGNILYPAANKVFGPTESITLFGIGFNYDQGLLPNQSLKWYIITSKEMYFMGSGCQLTVKPMAIGNHTIRLVVTDALNKEVIDERVIEIRDFYKEETTKKDIIDLKFNGS